MKQVYVLEKDDIIERNDLVRCLYSFREYDDRASRWMEAHLALPAWVGHTLQDLHNFKQEVASRSYWRGGVPPYLPEYQIMRIPKADRKSLGFLILEKLEVSTL